MQVSADKKQPGGAQERKGAASPRDALARAYRFADLSRYTTGQRLKIRAADLAFYLLIKLVGSTVRFRVEGLEHWEDAARDGPPVYVNWHERIFLSTYFWRGRRIVVMTSRSFDGEYIARFIQRFGYGAARGSSTRGGAGALVEMARLARAGIPVGFTIDGPRGPRRVAKSGAVLLAKKTGRAVLPFSVNPRRFWRLPTWDKMQIPCPFTHATVRIGAPIRVAADADDAALEAARAELQRSLEELGR